MWLLILAAVVAGGFCCVKKKPILQCRMILISAVSGIIQSSCNNSVGTELFS